MADSSAIIKAICTVECARATKIGLAPSAPVPWMPQISPAMNPCSRNAVNHSRIKQHRNWFAPITGIAIAEVANVILGIRVHFVSVASVMIAMRSLQIAFVASVFANTDGRVQNAIVMGLQMPVWDPRRRFVHKEAIANAKNASATSPTWENSVKSIRKRITNSACSMNPVLPV